MRAGGRALGELRLAMDRVLAAAPAIDGDQGDLLAFLSPLRTELNRGELAFATVAGKLTERYESSESMDPLSPVQLLRYECKMASGAAAAAVNVGEHMGDLPKSSEAVEQGRVGFAHLNLIAYAAAFVGDGFDESWLLKKAEGRDVTSFARICRRVRYRARPALCEQEERELHEARFFELTTRDEDGAVWLRGLLDAEGGAYLRTAVEGLAQKLPHDDRNAEQRRADALVEIARVALDEGRLPERGGTRPHLQVTASIETLLGRPGAPPAELEGSGPISVEMLRRIAGDCAWRRMLLDERSLVVDVGRERRTFSGATRLALEHRDQGCVWPGCTRAARFCRGDHEKEWWRGGETSAANGRLLCLYHDRLRQDGWQLTRVTEDDDGRRWLATPPLWAIAAPG